MFWGSWGWEITCNVYVRWKKAEIFDIEKYISFSFEVRGQVKGHSEAQGTSENYDCSSVDELHITSERHQVVCDSFLAAFGKLVGCLPSNWPCAQGESLPWLWLQQRLQMNLPDFRGAPSHSGSLLLFDQWWSNNILSMQSQHPKSELNLDKHSIIIAMIPCPTPQILL